MSTIVFSGPSGFNLLKTRFPSFQFEGPAQQGDIYRVAKLEATKSIILLDGFYKSVPAVWHKEILYAIEKGITVVGAASLGALRAVELDHYGMVGIGVIYKWYKDGTLYRDPDVAVAHTGSEDGYRPLTVPIVNIKATLKVLQPRLRCDEEEKILNAARRIYFEHRTTTSLVKVIGDSGLDKTQIDLVVDALMNHYIDQKTNDSIQALTEVSRISDSMKERNTFTFSNTIYWDAMRNNDSYIQPNSTGFLSTRLAFLAFQLLERPDAFMRMRQHSISLDLCLWLGSIYGIEASEPKIAATMKRLLSQLEINETELPHWLEQRGLDSAELNDFVRATVIEQAILDMLQNKNLLCQYNKFHYIQATLDQDGNYLMDTISRMGQVLDEDSLNAIDGFDDSEPQLPSQTCDVLNRYRKSSLLPISLSPFSMVTRFPMEYALSIAKYRLRFKKLIANKIRKLFNSSPE